MLKVCIHFIIAVISLSIGVPAAVDAQERYPSKPIRLILSIPAGSVTDITLRAAGQELLPRMGQPFVIEYRPGGNMIIAAEACANAAPDGYTLCTVAADTMSFNPHVFYKLPYDPDKSFKPIIQLYFLIEGVMASASVPAESMKELRALASAKRGLLNFASHGPNSNTDIFRQWLNHQWGTDVVGIPYKGGSQIIAALMANEVHLTKLGLGNLAGQLRGGKVKVLTVTSSKRFRLLPEVPTMAEAGLGENPIKAWFGLATPAGTPDAIVSMLNSQFLRLFREPKFLEYLETQLLESAVGTPEEFASFLKADRERAGALVKMFNIPRQ
jgi:tripartite-type tricarboxylate transporter receptor subunit TctC